MQIKNPITDSFFSVTNSTDERVDWLCLARTQNVGKITFFRLIDIFGSVNKALENVVDFSRQGGAQRNIKLYTKNEALQEIEKCKKINAKIINYSDEIYPQLLRQISDPAPVLTIQGNEEFLNKDQIAIVGTRNASFNGIAFAKKIATDLAKNSILVTSGLARGIDSAAHNAALGFGTIAVIGCGINKIYPPENAKLQSEIAKRGLIISEYAFDAEPKAIHFPQRNRLISGLSLAVIVIEAALKSGTLITANCALEQGKEVFAVPGSPFDPRCQGTNRLIKEGAKLLDDIADIIDDLPQLKARFIAADKVREDEQYPFITPQIKMPSEDDIKKVREEILQKLNYSPVNLEDLIAELIITPRLANIALVQLELADKVEVNGSKVVRKTI